MLNSVSELRPMPRLKGTQQIQAARVELAMMSTTKRNHAQRVITPALSPRANMRRIRRSGGTADRARFLTALLALRRGC